MGFLEALLGPLAGLGEVILAVIAAGTIVPLVQSFAAPIIVENIMKPYMELVLKVMLPLAVLQGMMQVMAAMFMSMSRVYY